jgi:hypothetical protein
VVLYFDERVRNAMTLPQRGRAIGWLGGILALGIFMPVMTLAGFIPDTARIRTSTVVILALFLLAAFGIAISVWGREDGQRLRAAPAPQVPPAPPVPSPSPPLSERERAAEVLGYAFLAVAQAGTVFTVLTSAEPVPDGEIARARDFLRCWSVRWTELCPSLTAIIVGYPSLQVREQVQVFIDAASRVLLLTVKLAGSGDPLDDEAREQLAGSASAQFAAVATAQKAIIAALHPEDGNGAHPPARARRSRAVTNGPGPPPAGGARQASPGRGQPRTSREPRGTGGRLPRAGRRAASSSRSKPASRPQLRDPPRPSASSPTSRPGRGREGRRGAREL